MLTELTHSWIVYTPSAKVRQTANTGWNSSEHANAFDISNHLLHVNHKATNDYIWTIGIYVQKLVLHTSKNMNEA